MSETGRTSPWRRYLLWFLISSFATALLLSADWYAADEEMDALLDATEASEAAQTSGYESMVAAVERSANDDGFLTEDERSALAAAVPREAAIGTAESIATRAVIEDLSFLPWHGSIESARDRYLDHAVAWEKYFTAVSEDYEALFASASDGQIDGTFRAAKRAYERAAPRITRHDASDRIESIFEE